jgi:hypothetical protein
MVPTWMIEELERMRRERIVEESRPRLELEIPTERDRSREPAPPAPREPIVIEF